MKCTRVDLERCQSFSKLFLAYTEHPETIRSFYKYPCDISSFKSVISDKGKEPTNRKLLSEVLKLQYLQVKHHNEVQKNIDLLTEPSTFTVCTGHQLCLFTGPLYFIYKIITTINLAEALASAYPAYNFVPVYWMASEDHDFEEINHFHLYGKKIVWEKDAAYSGSQVPVGSMDTKSIAGVIGQVKALMGSIPGAGRLAELLENAYLGNSTLAGATRSLVNELFGRYGLVVLDPDDAKLKKEFIPVMKDDLMNHTNFKMAAATVKQLVNRGIEVQVNPREINVFYIREGVRRRIVPAGSDPGPAEACVSFSPEMVEEAEQYPERFSPNVLLRPLYQEKILPNLAYVGGPGEIAYWLEFKAMFEHHSINFPVLIPRNFAMIVDPILSAQWEKAGFDVPDYFLDTEELVKLYVLKNSTSDISLSKEQEKLTDLFSGIAGTAERIDPTLKANVMAELQKASNALNNIAGKMLKAEKSKGERENSRIRKIKDKLFPEGRLQERYDNFIPYYLAQGEDYFELLKKEFNPFERKMLVFT